MSARKPLTVEAVIEVFKVFGPEGVYAEWPAVERALLNQLISSGLDQRVAKWKGR